MSLTSFNLEATPSESRVAQVVRTVVRHRMFDWCLLVGLMSIVPLLYLPYIFHNLPVSANVDERTSLAVLDRFQHGSLNPKFFMYPTLYFYVTYFFTEIAGGFAAFSSRLLILGRILNLSFVGLTAFLAYKFCDSVLRSKASGLIAAACVLTSSLVSESGSYLCTDVLLAAMTMASLLALTIFFHTHSSRDWLLGMILLGAAVGCKYTAVLLFVAYLLVEALVLFQASRTGESRERQQVFHRRAWVLALLLLLSLGFFAAALFFPTSAALRFVAQNRTNADLHASAEYLVFFGHIRRLLLVAGTALAALAWMARAFAPVYRLLTLPRLYRGLAIVLLVAYLTTPYSLIDPKRFLYDLGALFRNNIAVTSNHQEWGNYAHWLITQENPILLVLALVGFAILMLRRLPQLRLAGIYLLLYLLTIGSSHLGYPRYLVPVLPLFYCGTGVAIVALCARPALWSRVVAVVLVGIVGIQLQQRIRVDRDRSRATDAFLASYQVAKRLQPELLLYAGYAPSVELGMVGLHTQQMSWATLAGEPIGSRLPCGSLLLFDKEAARAHGVDGEGDKSVVLLLDDAQGYGQEAVRRADCP